MNKNYSSKKISAILIKYDRNNQIYDFNNYEGELFKVIKTLREHIASITPKVYSREKFVGEYIPEINIELVDLVFEDILERFSNNINKIIIEYSQKLKYLKISFSNNEDYIDNSNVKKLNKQKYYDKLSSYMQSKYLQIEYDYYRTTYILYFKSMLRTNLHRANRTKCFTKSELKVYDLISKSNYPLSREDIVTHTLLSPRTVSYAVGQLVENNFIKKINTSKNEFSRANKMNKYVKNIDEN